MQELLVLSNITVDTVQYAVLVWVLYEYSVQYVGHCTLLVQYSAVHELYSCHMHFSRALGTPLAKATPTHLRCRPRLLGITCRLVWPLEDQVLLPEPPVTSGTSLSRAVGPNAQKPRAARSEPHVFGERVISELPVVEAESAPEAHDVVRSARVEEAGARERLGLQQDGSLSRNRLLTPCRHFKGVDSLLNGQVLLMFWRAHQWGSRPEWNEKRQVVNNTNFRFEIRFRLEIVRASRTHDSLSKYLVESSPSRGGTPSGDCSKRMHRWSDNGS